MAGLDIADLRLCSITVVRTIRDDFAVEIWRDMGISGTPSVFATSETIVGIAVTAFCALTIWVAQQSIGHSLDDLFYVYFPLCW